MMYLKQAGYPNTNTRTTFLKLNQPLRKTNHEQKTHFCIAPNIWNNLPDFSKTAKGLNKYKHKIEKNIFLTE